MPTITNPPRYIAAYRIYSRTAEREALFYFSNLTASRMLITTFINYTDDYTREHRFSVTMKIFIAKDTFRLSRANRTAVCNFIDLQLELKDLKSRTFSIETWTPIIHDVKLQLLIKR